MSKLDTTDFTRDSSPLDALLAAYAAGLVSPPLGVLVRSHLALSPVNRPFVSMLETVGGVMIEGCDPKPLADRDRRLAAIFGQAASDFATPAVAESSDGVLPMPLRAWLGRDLDKVEWRGVMPGLKEHRIGEGDASLLWIAAGRKMPHHTHEGTEVTLVLKGSFRDKNGHFKRGDIAIGDEDLDHSPVADAAEDCFCFVVNDAPLRLTGPIGRVIELFRRH